MADLDTLARELVEAGMPWLEGMLDKLGRRIADGARCGHVGRKGVCDRPPGHSGFHADSLTGYSWWPRGERIPDLTDWPTIGALLGELSRQGRPSLRQWAENDWACDPDSASVGAGSVRIHRGRTPGEAVGRALLEVLRAEREAP